MSEAEIKLLSENILNWDSHKAFEEFYYLCYDRFFRIAFYYVKNEPWAKEVVLESFTKLWEKKSTLSKIANLEDYCFILVKNTALSLIAREIRIKEDSIDTYDVYENTSPEDSMISDEIFAAYVKALDKLPPRCREIFISIKEENLKYAQVAEQMNISIKTVDAQLQKAIRVLRKTPY